MGNQDVFERIHASVVEGDDERARTLAAEAVRAGLDPLEVLERGFTAALRQVGDCWERGTMFLPEMILAAEAVKAAMAELKPHLNSAEGEGAPRAVCVMGTVRGDIHDIGKNIVSTMLEAFGFTVVDLGTDVEEERFVSAVRETGATLVGISALLTSTMPEMRTVVEALKEAGLRSDVRVAIGGAPVTRAYAEEIGADGFADDGGAALRLFQQLAAGETSSDEGRGPREVRHAL